MTSVFALHQPERPPFRSRFTQAATVAAVALPLLVACGQNANAESLLDRPETATSPLMAQPGAEDTTVALLNDETELRRGYGIVDMRFEPCVAALGSQALNAAGCGSGFLIYGPYVNVPAKSDIEITFDIRPEQTLELYADVASQMGQRVLAGMNPQTVEAGTTRRLGYHVHVSTSDQYVESRLGIRSATPAGFSITNYTMTVR